MARFYGTVQGNCGEATRRGVNTIRVSAQSWGGSVVVRMFDERGANWVSISLGVGSTSSSDFTLYYGPISALFDDNKRNVIVEAFAREALAKQAGESE